MKKVIVITGPTCVGKTKLSVELAKKINGEIINADSTQVFKELDIATAKVTEEEKENVVHHLIDIKDMNEDYTVYDYQIDVRNLIKDIKSRKRVPILVGGTGLYIKAALYNYNFNDNVINDNYESLSDQELYNKLLKVDPDTNIHINNRKRVIRAYNYYLETKKKFSEKEKDKELLYDTIFIGLTTDRDYLYERINDRVDLMVENGLLEEAKKIYDSKINSKAINTVIGYKELFPYFKNIDTLENCLDKIRQSSRRYAKKQYTFFNNSMNINWFEVDFNNFNNTINDVFDYINKNN